jgi:tRNA (cmo5U34)-methyltransferase
MSIDQAFNASIDYYDDWMKKALPNYTDLFRSAREIIPFSPGARISVLDLGAGTGLFSKHVLDQYPQANFVLYDVADKMLGVAKTRFNDQLSQFRFQVGDYREMEYYQDFDLVISSLSIHHLSDEEKRVLFQRIYASLRTPGAFINVDQVRGESGYIRDLYWNHWLEQVRRAESSAERIQESIQRRTTYDREATLVDQLTWLKEAGFVNVDCVYKNFFVGVFLAMKA